MWFFDNFFLQWRTSILLKGGNFINSFFPSVQDRQQCHTLLFCEFLMKLRILPFKFPSFLFLLSSVHSLLNPLLFLGLYKNSLHIMPVVFYAYLKQKFMKNNNKFGDGVENGSDTLCFSFWIVHLFAFLLLDWYF